MRCVRCGDPWREDAAPCCMDPVVGFVRVVRRDGLTTVYSDDGDVIAAVRETLQPMASVTPLDPPDPKAVQDDEIDLEPPPFRGRGTEIELGA